MNDPELIRKAAEAIYSEISRDTGVRTFPELGERVKQGWDRVAEAALKVFYEHTQTQKPSRVGW